MSAFTISANAAAFGSVKVRASRRDTALPGEMEELGSFRRESVLFPVMKGAREATAVGRCGVHVDIRHP